MKKCIFFVIGILVLGTAQLSAQVEFIDQMGIGGGYGFVEDKGYAGGNFNFGCLLGVHVHNWNTAILVGIRSGFFGEGLSDKDLDVGGQIEHYFGFLNSRRLTGYGVSLASGVQLSSDDEAILYIRPGAFWHFATMIKLALELDYRFNGQISAEVMLSLPVFTVYSRLNNYKRIYLEKNK